jgi:hypothetical protein
MVGSSVAVRKVWSCNPKTTVSNLPRPEHDSRVTDAPVLHRVPSTAETLSARGDDMALRQQRLSQRRKACQSEVWLGRAEFENLIRQ